MTEALEQRGRPFVRATALSQGELPEAYALAPHCEKPLVLLVLTQLLAEC